MSLAELPKQYDPQEAQERWYPFWVERGYFQAKPGRGTAPYTIVIPPPNVTGALHLGHALNNTLQDILIRWRRMQGRDVLWMPGTDHAGIATQAVVEKRLRQEEGKTRHDIGREALVQRIWAWKDEYEARILSQLKRMGCSCDWSRTRFTLDATCARAVRAAFFRMFHAGLIYRGKRLVNWDTQLQTAVANDEVYYEDVQGKLWTLAYPVTNDPATRLHVATTRPETMLGDTAVAVHPKDPRYKHLIGLTVTLPLSNREIPIVGDGELVDPKFGTGCVKVTPAHDPNDYKTGLRHSLPRINLLNPDGTYNENAGAYQGLPIKQVRKRVLADLEEQGYLVETKDHPTRINYSDRSKTAIEPFLSDQWFVFMGDRDGQPGLAQQAMDAVTSGRVTFHPERYAKGYLDWLKEKQDWCISRQLWWGHRIPIWSAPAVEESRLTSAFEGRDDVHWTPDETRPGGWLICALEDLPADALGDDITLEQDPDVLDTWFSSALWPHSTLGWPEPTKDLETYYPTSVLSTARDIISLWVARMIIFGQFNMNDVPFTNVYIHSVILDGNGERMSKSKGNGVDPVDIIDLFGADTLRYTLAAGATETQDLRMPVSKTNLDDGREVNTSKKFEENRPFPNKIWNAARFALMHLDDKPIADGPLDREALPVEDRWILSRLAQAARDATIDLEAFRFADAAKGLREFTWNDFCDYYLEFIKTRLADEQAAPTARRTLAIALDGLCRLLHPIMPFVTEQIWQALNQSVPTRGLGQPEPAAESVCIAEWPNAEAETGPLATWIDAESEAQVAQWREKIIALRTLRAERRLPPSAKIAPTIVAAGSVAATLEAGASRIAPLAGAETLTIVNELAERPQGAAVVVLADAEIIVPLEGLIDLDAERARLDKERDQIAKQLKGIESKLANEKFVSNAPAEVVDQQRAKLAELQGRHQTVEALLAEYGG